MENGRKEGGVRCGADNDRGSTTWVHKMWTLQKVPPIDLRGLLPRGHQFIHKMHLSLFRLCLGRSVSEPIFVFGLSSSSPSRANITASSVPLSLPLFDLRPLKKETVLLTEGRRRNKTLLDSEEICLSSGPAWYGQDDLHIFFHLFGE